MGTMATAAAKKQRETLGAVNAFLNQKDPVLFVFRNIGDRARGTVVGAAMVDSEIGGTQKRNAAGIPKKHLQVYLTSPEGDKLVVNVQSQNQRESLAKGLENAALTGLAIDDFFSQEYVGDDDIIREGLSPARQFVTEITASE